MGSWDGYDISWLAVSRNISAWQDWLTWRHNMTILWLRILLKCLYLVWFEFLLAFTCLVSLVKSVKSFQVMVETPVIRCNTIRHMGWNSRNAMYLILYALMSWLIQHHPTRVMTYRLKTIAGRHTSSCPSMPSNAVVIFFLMAGSTLAPAPWMTNLRACSMVSLHHRADC